MRREVKSRLVGFAVLMLHLAVSGVRASDTCYWHGVTSNLLDPANWSFGPDGSGGQPVTDSDLVDDFSDGTVSPTWSFIDETIPQDATFEESGGYLVLSSRGNELWGDTASFAGLWRADMTGDFDVWVKVVSMTHTHDFAKAGIMVANDISDLSKGGCALICASHSANGVLWDWDEDGDGQTDWHRNAGRPVSFDDLWVRMKKVGTVFSTYYRESSSAAWAQIYEDHAIDSAWQDMEICLFAFSHDDDTVCTARFDNFSVAGCGTATLPCGLALRFDGTGAGANANCSLTSSYDAATVDVLSYGGTLSLGSHTLTCSTLTVDSAAVNADSAHICLTGNLTIGTAASFNRGASTVLLNGASGTQQLWLNGGTLNNLMVATTGASIEFVDNAVIHGDLTVSSGTPSTFCHLGGKTITVQGSAWFRGQATSLLNMNPSTVWSIVVTGTLNAEYASIANSNAATSTGQAASTCVDGGGNTNWIFAPQPPEAYYWHGATSDFNDPSNWTKNSDGSGLHPATPGDLVAAFDDSTVDSSWTSIDQTVPQDAAFEQTDGHLVLSGRGNELWGDTASFSGLWRTDITGDFDVCVKVVSMTNTHEWAKAGILVANDIDSLAAGGYSLIAATPGHGAAWDLDTDGDGATDLHRSSGMVLSFTDLWLRVKKFGTTISTFYREAEGHAWTQIDVAREAGRAQTNSEICLFVCSHDDDSLCVAQFDQFTATGAVPAEMPDGLALLFAGSGQSANSNCVLTEGYTAAAIDLSSYSGVLSLGGHSLTCSTLSIVSGAVHAESSTVTVRGDLTIADQAGLFHRGTSTVRLTGSGRLSNPAWENRFYRIEVGLYGEKTTLVSDLKAEYVEFGGGTVTDSGTGRSVYIYPADSAKALDISLGSSMEFGLLGLRHDGQGTCAVPSFSGYPDLTLEQHDSGSVSYLLDAGGLVCATLAMGGADPAARQVSVDLRGNPVSCARLVLGSTSEPTDHTLRAGGAHLDINGALILNGVDGAHNTLELGAAHVTLAGSWANHGVLVTPGTSTVELDGSVGVQTLQSNGQPFHSLVLNPRGASVALLDDIVCSGDFKMTQTQAGSFTGLGGKTIDVAGDAFVQGTDTSYLNLTPEIQWQMAAQGRLAASYARVANCHATASPGEPTVDCIDGGGNTNWNFPPVSAYYWHGQNTDFNDWRNWTSLPDGTGAHAPTTSHGDSFDEPELGTQWAIIDRTGTQDGTVMESGGVLTLQGRGSELWDADNEFVGVYRTDIPGDFDVSVQIHAMDSTHGWAKAGIIFANDLRDLAQGGYGLVGASPSDFGAFLNYDLTGDGTLDHCRKSGSLLSFEGLHVRIVKQGTLLRAFYREGADSAWVEIGTEWNVPSLSPDQQIGLFVFSHDSTQVCSATFDEFRVEGSEVLAPELTLRFDGTGGGADTSCLLTADYVARKVDLSGYAGTFGFGGHTLCLLDDFIVAQTATIDTAEGTVDFAAPEGEQLLVLGSTTAVLPQLVHTGAGRLRLSNASLQCKGFTQVQGELDLGGCNLTTVDGGGFAVYGGATSSLSNLAAQTITVSGSAILEGTWYSLLGLAPSESWTIAVSGTLAANYAQLGNSTASLCTGQASANCVNLGGNVNWVWPENYDRWAYSRKIALNTSTSGANIAAGEQVDNFPVLIRLASAEFDGWSTAAADGADVRFSGEDGSHLSYHLETWNSQNQQAAVWVKVPVIAGDNAYQFITMHWGMPGVADSSDGTEVFKLDNAFGGVWHLSETAQDGTAGLYDATANANCLTPYNFSDGAGGSTGAEALVCYGAVLDSINDGMGGPDAAVLEPRDNLTVSCWIKPTTCDTGGSFVVMNRNDETAGAPAAAYLMYLDDTALKPCFQWAGSDGQICEAVAATPLSTGQWHHLAGTRNGGVLSIFVDGVDVTDAAASSGTPTGQMLDPGLGLRIGAQDWDNGSHKYAGGLDELRIGSAARSAAWIKLCYENQRENQTLVQMEGTTMQPLADTDGDGVINAIEIRMGTSPVVWADAPTVAIPDTAVVVDATRDMRITYNCRPHVGGYGARDSVVILLRAGTVPQDSLVPIVEMKDTLDAAIPALPQGYRKVGRFVDIHGTLTPGATAEIALPLPDRTGLLLPDRIKVVHYDGTRWRFETINRTDENAVYVSAESFSPYAVLEQPVHKAVAYVDGHSVFENTQGKAWVGVDIKVVNMPLLEGEKYFVTLLSPSHVPYIYWFMTADVEHKTLELVASKEVEPGRPCYGIAIAKWNGDLLTHGYEGEVTINTGERLQFSGEITYEELLQAEAAAEPAFLSAKTLSTQMELVYRNIMTPFGVEGRLEPGANGMAAHYYVRDHLGSTRMVLAEDGTPAEATGYYCYGEQFPIQEATDRPAREKFTGKELDTEGDFDRAEIQLDITVTDIAATDTREFTVHFADGSMRSVTMDYTSKYAPITYVYRSIHLTDSKTISEIAMRLKDGLGNEKEYRVTGFSDAVGLGSVVEISLGESYGALGDGQFVTGSVDDHYTILGLGATADVAGVMLDYFGARYLHADLGCWTATDPMREFSNLYSYLGGNPMLFVDLLGLEKAYFLWSFDLENDVKPNGEKLTLSDKRLLKEIFKTWESSIAAAIEKYGEDEVYVRGPENPAVRFDYDEAFRDQEAISIVSASHGWPAGGLDIIGNREVLPENYGKLSSLEVLVLNACFQGKQAELWADYLGIDASQVHGFEKGVYATDVVKFNRAKLLELFQAGDQVK